ncbi:MAG: hypothetical protein ISR59_03885 [Anaerolineales bacterium]|uniref:Uncharacterized protein n=1 Tax=Candidatus Desulfolinea nitratireducens TaxID=2841698 RepID=A0A8J6NIS5_9CHLR|nr:hypothetical protein [Candidatus Desulfolinea nitratireducens]MBL6960225.1 hypothetical protein [Anaerolineales bacterium]
MLKFFTYTDLSGKRRLRTYVIIAIASFALLLLLAGGAMLWRISEFDSTDIVETPVFAPLRETAIPETPPTNTPEVCPSNPADWALLDLPLSKNYKSLNPACVYTELGRTVAWVLAISEGYSRAEATEVLGFSTMPMTMQTGELTILTDNKGPLSVQMLISPQVPGLAQWAIDGAGNPATAMALRGCFRTFTFAGNEQQNWGDGYEVICVVSKDTEASYGLMQLGEHLFIGGDGQITASRTFLLFGYKGKRWTWLGWREDGGRVDYEEIGLTAELATADREMKSSIFSLPLWDSAWLEESYGLAMKALPDSWKDATDTAIRDAILNEINAYFE